uniref:Protein krueppel n=1 Tax=Anopheles atroparvus TaxID=41427 RepID=A0AAG5CYK9_ANOAO
MLSSEESENLSVTQNPQWNTCRTCLQSGDTRSLFDKDLGVPLSYADKVMLCTNMIIREDDNLPDRICVECIGELEVAYRFRLNCDSSNAILQSYLEGAEDKPSEAESTAVLTESEFEEIAIPLDSGVLYTYKPPSGLNVKLIQRSAEGGSVCPVPETRWTEGVPMLAGNVQDETLEPMSNNYDGSSVSEMDLQTAALNDRLTRGLSENGDIKIERLEGSDTEEYVSYETVLESNNEMIVEEVDNITPLETTSGYSSKKHGGVPENLVPPKKSVRTLQTIRKTNTPNEVKPTIETVTTQTAADGSGMETVIRVKRNLPNAKQTHVCEICNTTYKHKHALETHLRRHRGDRPHKCTHCDKAFVVPFELQRHIRTHTGHKPYKCQYCDRAYSDFGSKTKHERTHTGERPYRCNYCCKTFSYSHVLTSHLLIHTGEKKYSCSTCGKRFAKSHHLKGHQKTHLTVSAKGAGGKEETAEEMKFEEALTEPGGSVNQKDESTSTVILMEQQSDQGLVDSYVNATRLATTGWTLADVGLPLPDTAADTGGTDLTTLGGGSVVTIGAEELGNVSIVSFSDYMIKTEAIERLMMHGGGETSSGDGTTDHTHGVVDALSDFVTVLLPKSDSTLVDAGFGHMEMIDG